jgi:PST family polysaccharide transporter
VARSNVFWSGVEAAGAAALSLASALVVARLVGPAEVGIGAAAAAVNVLIWVVVNALFADALVQRAALADREAEAAFWAGVMLGCLAGLLQLALGPVLAALLHDPRLTRMATVLACPLPLVGAGGVVQGMLTRQRRYRALAARTVLGQGLAALAGIALAVTGAGAWAIVGQQAVVSGAGAAVLLAAGGWRPRLPGLGDPAVWLSVRALLSIGIPLTASTLVQHGRYRVFAVLIGATAGPAVLGQLHLAFRLVDTLRDLAITALWRLALPLLSEQQHDPRALRMSLDRVARLSALVLFPVFGATAATLGPLVAVAFGPAWHQAAEAAEPLVGLGVVLVAVFPGSVAAIALGHPRIALAGNAMALVLTVLGVSLMRPAGPTDAALAWVGAQLAVVPPVQIAIARRLGMTVLAMLAPAAPALAIAGLATSLAIALPWLAAGPSDPFIVIAARLAVGGGVYVAGVLMLLRTDFLEAAKALGLPTPQQAPAPIIPAA